MADDNFLQSQNIDGSENVEIFNEDRDDLCHYQVYMFWYPRKRHKMKLKIKIYSQGQIRNKPNSRVALSTCDGIHGIVDDGKHSYQISPVKSYALNEPHYIIR